MEIAVEQAGFRQGRGGRKQVANIRKGKGVQPAIIYVFCVQYIYNRHA